SSCDVLQSVATLATNCEYKVSSVTNYSVAGLDVANKKKLSDFNFMDAASVSTALLTKSLPIKMTVNVGVENSGPEARLNTLEWQAFVENKPLAIGKVEQPVTIPATGKGNIPLTVTADLFEVLSGESRDMILNTALTLLTGEKTGTPSKLNFKVRPSYNVGGQIIQHPNYINIKL
ncbi:MAG: hypothetical protein ACPG4W_08615, partial [Flavobacteriales bacterium]